MSDPPTPPDVEVSFSHPTGLHVTTENRPYHILYVADFAGSKGGSISGPLGDGVVPVTASSRDEVMRAARPTVRLSTSDPLAAGNVLAEVDLSFDSLKCFDPTSVVKQIPAAGRLHSIRESIVDRMHGKLPAAGLDKAVADAVSADASLAWLAGSLKWTAKERAADATVVDDLLGQIDLGDGSGDEPSEAPKSPIGRIVSAAAGSGGTIPAEEASALRRTLAETDRRISMWLTTVLHSPEIQGLESVWRSLAFLVSHLDFRKGVRLSVLHASDSDLLERFRTKLVDPVFDEGAEAPDLIVVDHQFGNSAPDMEALDELAQHGASLPAVVVAGASPGFFGAKHSWQIATLPPVTSMMDQWQFAKWKGLRGAPYARLLGVVFGRCLLRTPHGRREAGDLEFAYKEECVTDRDLVWASGAVAVACTAARSVADSGWPTALSGPVHGRLEGFKTCEGGKKGDKTFGPADTQLSEAKIEELGMAGINAVVGARDHDDVLVWNGMTAARAPRNDMTAVLEVSLPYQLFVARLSGLLFALRPKLLGFSGEKVCATVTQHIRDWVAFEGDPTPEQLSVLTRPVEDNPATLELAVTVTPPAQLVPGDVPVVMGYRLA